MLLRQTQTSSVLNVQDAPRASPTACLLVLTSARLHPSVTLRLQTMPDCIISYFSPSTMYLSGKTKPSDLLTAEMQILLGRKTNLMFRQQQTEKSLKPPALIFWDNIDFMPLFWSNLMHFFSTYSLSLQLLCEIIPYIYYGT